jgi:signal transduction histidine kinase
MMFALHAIEGPDHGRVFPLPAGEPQLIGRSSEAIPLSDRTVSRRHAELTPDGDRWYLADLESANGTMLNGHLVTDRMVMEPGDEIRCGSSVYRFAPISESQVMSRIGGDLSMDLPATGLNLGGEESIILSAPDSLEAAQEQLRVLMELSRITTSVIDRDHLLERLTELVQQEFDADRAMVLLGSEPRGELVLAGAKGRDPIQDLTRWSEVVAQRGIEQSSGLLATDAQRDPRFSSCTVLGDIGVHAVMAAPMLVAGNALGVIIVESMRDHWTWTPGQLQLLTAMSHHGAMTLHNMAMTRDRLHEERLATMGRTVASISHGVKNILQGLSGGAGAIELAIAKGDLEMAREGWPILSRNLDRIVTLTSNMLSYSRSTAMEFEPIIFRSLIDEAIECVSAVAGHKGVEVIVNDDGDHPPIMVDAASMHRCLMNLLLNAIEVVPEGTGLVELDMTLDDDVTEMTISINDNGSGLPLSHDPHAAAIFEPFVSTKGQRGTGLGLAVTKKIVEAHGGLIEARKSDLGGAVFSMTLPMSRPGDDPADTSSPPRM